MTYDAVLFDLDGVLVDSNAIYERHWKCWADRHGVSFAHIEAVHHGRPAVQIIQLVAPHLDAAVEAQRYNVGVAADRSFEGVSAFDGVHAVLRSLPMDRWAIATSATRAVALALLERLDLPLPRVIVTSDDVPRGKPDPAPYLQAASGLGHHPSRCVVIEDAPAGITAARAAGACVIALSTTNPVEQLQEAHAIRERFLDIDITPTTTGLKLALHG